MLADTSRYSEVKSQPRKLLTHINGLNRPASCTLFFPPHGCLPPEHRPGYRDKATLYHPIDKCTISKTSLRDIWKTQRQQRRAQISLPLQRTKRKRKRKPRKVIQSIRGLSTVKGAASNYLKQLITFIKSANHPHTWVHCAYSVKFPLKLVTSPGW